MQERWLKYALLAPAMLVIGLMAAFPLIYSLILSFRSWKLAKSSTPGVWLGFENYRNLLTDDPEFWDAVRATAIFVGADVVATLAIALGLALILQRSAKINSLARVMLILPFVMSPALIGISFRFFLNPEYGVGQAFFAQLIPALQGKVWLSNKALAMTAVVASDVWHWAPYMTLVMIGGLASIPKETLEAAQVD